MCTFIPKVIWQIYFNNTTKTSKCRTDALYKNIKGVKKSTVVEKEPFNQHLTTNNYSTILQLTKTNTTINAQLTIYTNH